MLQSALRSLGTYDMTYLRACLALCLAASAGCGLISSDVADVELDLPEKRFSIDTSSWQVDEDKAKLLFATDCALAPTACDAVVKDACKMGCSAACVETQRCELRYDVALYQKIDLVMEKPELSSIGDKPIVDVTIDRVTYRVTANTLSVATPELGVFLAPVSVMDSNDELAIKIGTIPPVEAGVTIDPEKELVFTANGKAKLDETMSSFKTPFHVIIGSQLATRGTPLPTGKLDAALRIRAHAGL